VTINRMLKRRVGRRSDTKVRFCSVFVLRRFCLEMKRVTKTNQYVIGQVAKTAQCEANAVDRANDQADES
jgi:hypothetical protein